MAPRSFLSLPYELRHQIYQEYFTLPGGYAFQPGPGKLAALDGQPLDLALMYTCRFIAFETKDIPLALNNITFSTVYHPEWSAWAGRFDHLLYCQGKKRYFILLCLLPYITPKMYSRIESRFPWFILMLRKTELEIRLHGLPETNPLGNYNGWSLRDCICNHSFWDPRGRSDSSVWSATDFTLRLLAQSHNREITPRAKQATESFRNFSGLTDLLGKAFRPWDIPKWDELAIAGHEFRDGLVWEFLRDEDHNERYVEPKHKFRFSATSVAIRFLQDLPVDKRLCIRNLVLLEDSIAVGQQECHSLGLIPFCRENLRLKIDLRVSMVKNIFQGAAILSDGWIRFHPGEDREIFNAAIEYIPERVADWLKGAVALRDAGMPIGSFTLTLDSEGFAETCTDIFQSYILWHVSMQKAMNKCFPLPQGTGRRRDPGDIVDPHSIQSFDHLVGQTSIVRSNFHPGKMWDVERLIEERVGYDPEQWYSSYLRPPEFRVPEIVHLFSLGRLMAESCGIEEFHRRRNIIRRRRS
ncbi:hypothetical protein FLONG3_9013 [Fusarium longipes]|uniref:Uncharacterized protein n=1 Tax=Fusarium longipes TaxID=694270 RepID=A0A395S0F8_9HYPO|nr:hypothetical protein FLONG3_9013 [Fusarium longipes]